MSLRRLLKESKDSNLIVIAVEDTAAMAGLVTALVGTLLAVFTGMPVFDGIASIVIGLLLGAMSLFLAAEMRKLLVGEAIDRAKITAVRELLAEYPEIERVVGIWTMQLGIGSSTGMTPAAAKASTPRSSRNPARRRYKRRRKS